jgi:hypothetical protein
MRHLLPWLRRFLPGWGFAVVMTALAASGWWLHETERFASIAWGLTEQVHVFVGWVSLVGTALYLVHHLARTWGPWKTLQRILGLSLATATAVALASGVVLVMGIDGGPPEWVRMAHWISTWLLTGLFIWHAAKGAWRATRLWVRRLIRGPVAVSTAEPDVPASADPPGATPEAAAPAGEEPPE